MTGEFLEAHQRRKLGKDGEKTVVSLLLRPYESVFVVFATALALMSRRSTTHRRIINDKADYSSGKGFTFDPEVPLLGAVVAQVNGSGESLRQVCSKLSFDKSLCGNAFLEVVTDEKHSFLALYHQDASP